MVQRFSRLAPLLLAAMLILAACGEAGTATTTAPTASGAACPPEAAVGADGESGPVPAPDPTLDQGRKLTIGFVVKTLTNPFYIKMQKAALAAAEDYNVDLLFKASTTETDTTEFIAIVEDLIQQQVDGLILVVGAPDEMGPTIQKARDAGIPVMATETDIPDADVITFLGISNQDAAASIVEYIHDTYVVEKGLAPEDAEVAILQGVAGFATAINRAEGYHIGLKEFWPEATIVAEQPADWDRTKGLDVATNILQANPNISVIFGSNDEMALGAYEAVENAGATDRIIVTGFDATLDALNSVKEGQLAATLDQAPDKYGADSVRIMGRYLRVMEPCGYAYPRLMKQETPLVTPENVDEFIKKAQKFGA